MSNVLVTGGSGFIAGHVLIQLLGQGHTVRATLRSFDKEASVRAILRGNGAVSLENLSFVEADLMDDGGWSEAVSGVDHVIHLASPVHTGKVKDENEVIGPARDGPSGAACGMKRRCPPRRSHLRVPRRRLRPRKDRPCLHRG